MYKHTKFRPAIAMIELIFAIVIIGIVLMSVPMLMQQSADSSFVAIQQEGISEASTRVNMIMSHHWDEGSSDPTMADIILPAPGGDSELNEATDVLAQGLGRRTGSPQETLRSFVNEDGDRGAATAALGIEGADRNDVDDFHGQLGLVQIAAAGDNDYIETATISIDTAVTYISDEANYTTDTSIVFSPNFANAGAITNIKGITTTLTSTAVDGGGNDVDELAKTIVLRSFSCNIGGYRLENRTF